MKEEQQQKRRILLPAAMLILAAAFVLIGIFRDQVGEVLMKAVKICLECIGIG